MKMNVMPFELVLPNGKTATMGIHVGELMAIAETGRDDECDVYATCFPGGITVKGACASLVALWEAYLQDDDDEDEGE